MKPSLIRSSVSIHKSLSERKEELGLTLKQIKDDANSFGVTMDIPQLSKYFRKEEKYYGLNEKQILFLCVRYGVSVSLEVGKISYNEQECINRVKKFLNGK